MSWKACFLLHPIGRHPDSHRSPLEFVDRPTHSITQSFNSHSVHGNILVARRQHLPRSPQPIRRDFVRARVENLADSYRNVDTISHNKSVSQFIDPSIRNPIESESRLLARSLARCLLFSTDWQSLALFAWGFQFYIV
jgi:hypothetical protein